MYFGCANQAGEDSRDVARMSLILADYPLEVAGATVNRLCGSGLEAVAQAARAVMLGEADVYVGGGRGVDEPRAARDAEGREGVPVGPPHGLRLNARLAHDQSRDGAARPHRLARDDRGEPGRRARDSARAPGPLRAPQPREGGGRDRRRALRRRDGGRDGEGPQGRHGGGGRRGAPARQHARGAGQAQAGLQGGRHRDRGELEPPERRRRRGDGHERRIRQGARPATRWRRCARLRWPACRRGSWASARCRPRRRRSSAPA